MTKEEAINMMEHIDPGIIDEADTYLVTKKKSPWVKWVVMAACLCLVIAGTFVVNELISDKPIANGTQEPAIADTELYIPALELPDTAADMVFDMIGLVVYDGGIYTQAESYYGDDALIIDKLVGDYLGYATGSINEWSTQEEYAEEFASSLAGKVYEVIGYDTDFRVCIREEVENENGEKQLWIQFLDRLNGITLTTGKDLFETRLHLRNRVAAIHWQSHEDWNYGEDNIQNAAIDGNLWEEFLNQIDNGTFVNTWNPEISSNTVYDAEKQAHIILAMEDETVIRLRLIEGGYVGYDALGWYFVQIPGEIFDSVFAACGGKNL